MKRAIVHPDADAELLEAMDWYDDKQAGIGLELMIEVRQAIERINAIQGLALGIETGRFAFFECRDFLT